MRTVVRLVVALALAGCGVAVVAGPALAAAPALTLLVSGPIAPDASVPMIGVGCPASSPVSIDVWDTSKPGSHLDLDGIRTASPSGSFGYTHDLAGHFDPGAEIGFYFSCTAAVDWTWDLPSATARTKYLQTTISDPHVEILAPARAPFGMSEDVWLRTDAVFGNVSLTVDGTPLPVDAASHYGAWLFHLAAGLAVGSHVLHASWTPQAPGSPTVTDDASVEVVRVTPTLTLTANRAKVHLGHRIRLTVTLSVPDTVSLLDGRKSLRQLTVPASGTLQLRVRLKGIRKHRLRVVFAGDDRTAAATSAVVRVRVRR